MDVQFIPSQFPSPMRFVKEKDVPSTEKPHQFMCHYHCQYMQSYFCFSSDHVDMLAMLMSYSGAAAWQNRGCAGAWRDVLIISMVYNLRTVLTARQHRDKVAPLTVCRAFLQFFSLLPAPCKYFPANTAVGPEIERNGKKSMKSCL